MHIEITDLPTFLILYLFVCAFCECVCTQIELSDKGGETIWLENKQKASLDRSLNERSKVFRSIVSPN